MSRKNKRGRRAAWCGEVFRKGDRLDLVYDGSGFTGRLTRDGETVLTITSSGLTALAVGLPARVLRTWGQP